jgi:6-phosphogluconolactonase (cycloisomerase 2 family)
MTRRAGGPRLSGVQPLAQVRDRLLRRASVVGALVGACCLLGASAALAGAPPAFTQVSGSPYATGGSPDSVAFSPAGGLVASANGGDSTLSMFTVSPNGALNTVPGSPDPTGDSPNAVAFSSNGWLLASANAGDDTVSVFTVSASGALTQVGSPVATGSDPVSIAFSPNGGLLATANDNDDTVSVFTVSASGALTAVTGSPYTTGNSPTSAAFSPDGRLLATANQDDSTASVFSVSSIGALTAVEGSPYTTGAGPNALAFSRDGLLAVVNQTDSTLSMFSVGPPTALINSPARAATYNLNEEVATSFSCADAPGAPGISACTDSNGATGTSGALDTKIAGAHSYTVTATSSDRQTATATISYTVVRVRATATVPPVSGCPRATGRLRGGTLGLVALGMTRAQTRRRYNQGHVRTGPFEDFFCLNPVGVRVGYASTELLTTLPAKARGKLRGRAVLALSANSFYALRGIHPGATLRAAATRLHTGAAMHIGASDWYMVRDGSTTGVIDVQHGIVVDVGIANAKLTNGRKAQLRFIKRFS